VGRERVEALGQVPDAHGGMNSSEPAEISDIIT